jgi:hypothetical protein
MSNEYGYGYKYKVCYPCEYEYMYFSICEFEDLYNNILYIVILIHKIGTAAILKSSNFNHSIRFSYLKMII